MKRLILIAVFVLTTGTLAAQNYIIVNSEKVFKSIDAYNTALSTLDKLAEQYQDMVDAKFAEVETLYNNYMNQKASLTAATRQTRENDILAKEKAAQEYQETLFGNDGTLMKKRIEMSRSRNRFFPRSKPMPNRWVPTWCSIRPTTRRCSTRTPVWIVRSRLSTSSKNRIIKTLTDNL